MVEEDTITGPEIGRVLRASTSGFAVGSRVSQLSEPSFGSLVKAQPTDKREAIFGLIYDIHIDDDPLVRRLVLAESPRQSVIEDQRQNRLLPIEMSVLTIGYKQGSEIHHTLPPRPPLNLDPVYLCQERKEITSLTDSSNYLRLILRADGGQVPLDQLLTAHIRLTYQQRGSDRRWAMETLRELIDLLRGNYELLVPTLESISDTLPFLDDDLFDI